MQKKLKPEHLTPCSHSEIVAGLIQHELFHVLGLYHTQLRPDRDLHIRVHRCAQFSLVQN